MPYLQPPLHGRPRVKPAKPSDWTWHLSTPSTKPRAFSASSKMQRKVRYSFGWEASISGRLISGPGSTAGPGSTPTGPQAQRPRQRQIPRSA
jgi:hypothetical protein